MVSTLFHFLYPPSFPVPTSQVPTCTLASLRSSRMARSSLVKTSGYCVLSNDRSSWCSWNVVNVVRDRRTC